MTAEAPINSPLFDLPPELWCRIARFSLEHEQYDLSDPDDLAHFEKTRPLRRSQPPVTRTCRALRHELLPYYYGKCLNIFLGPYPSGSTYDELGFWLKVIGGANRRLLTNLTFFAFPTEKDVMEKVMCAELGVKLTFHRGTASSELADIVPPRLEILQVGKSAPDNVWFYQPYIVRFE